MRGQRDALDLLPSGLLCSPSDPREIYMIDTFPRAQVMLISARRGCAARCGVAYAPGT